MESLWDPSYNIPNLWFRHPTCISITRLAITSWVCPPLPILCSSPRLLTLFTESDLCYSSFLRTISGCHGLLNTHCCNGVVWEVFHYFGIFTIMRFCLLFPTTHFLGRPVLSTALLFWLYRAQLSALRFLKQPPRNSLHWCCQWWCYTVSKYVPVSSLWTGVCL